MRGTEKKKIAKKFYVNVAHVKRNRAGICSANRAPSQQIYLKQIRRDSSLRTAATADTVTGATVTAMTDVAITFEVGDRERRS